MLRNAGPANLEMRTDLTQLLNDFRPMIGDSWRLSTPTSGRALSNVKESEFRQKHNALKGDIADDAPPPGI